MALWAQLKEDYASKVKLNVCALRDEISAVQLGDCDNMQDDASKIKVYMNNFNLSADSDISTGEGGTMPHSEHT
jgi:hypothetical protein